VRPPTTRGVARSAGRGIPTQSVGTSVGSACAGVPPTRGVRILRCARACAWRGAERRGGVPTQSVGTSFACARCAGLLLPFAKL
jgi:hypothetical protein